MLIFVHPKKDVESICSVENNALTYWEKFWSIRLHTLVNENYRKLTENKILGKEFVKNEACEPLSWEKMEGE